MITLLLACAAPDSDTTSTPLFGADTDAKDTDAEGPAVRTVVEDLGVCGAEGELDVELPAGKILALQAAVVFDDGRTLFQTDGAAYAEDGWVVVRCMEGQPVTVTMWVLTE